MATWLQKVWVQRFLFLAAVLVLWDGFFRLGGYTGNLFASPTDVADSLAQGLRSGRLPEALLASLRRLVVGYGLSIGAGVVLGTVLAASRPVKNTLGALMSGLQALPSISWLPLALLWFGAGEGAILFVTVMGSFLAITVSTEDAVRNVPPLYYRAGEVLGARGCRLYCQVILPAAFPAIATGLKLGWSFAWRSLMGAELIVSTASLGQLLSSGRAAGDTALLLAVMLVIVAVGLAFDRFVFGALDRVVRTRWGFQGRAVAAAS